MRNQIRSAANGRLAVPQIGHWVTQCGRDSPSCQLLNGSQRLRLLRCQRDNPNIVHRAVSALHRLKTVLQISDAFRRMSTLLLDMDERSLDMDAQHGCPVVSARFNRNVRQHCMIRVRFGSNHRWTERGDAVGENILGHHGHSVRDIRRIASEVVAEAAWNIYNY